jgi:hypothetical protein
VIIAWAYDGTSHNGMPDPDTNAKMRLLEEKLTDAFEEKQLSERAYSRTGNNLKEFAFYVADTGAFMKQLNLSLNGLPRFPINVTFYRDDTWSDFGELVALFRTDSVRPDA